MSLVLLLLSGCYKTINGFTPNRDKNLLLREWEKNKMGGKYLVYYSGFWIPNLNFTLLLLLLSRFSCVQFCATPWTAAHQAPPSLGFSRQEHWSGLPFPSPMHQSEKWKWSHSAMSDSSGPHGLQPTRLLRPWDFPGESIGVGCHCLLQLYTTSAYFSIFNFSYGEFKYHVYGTINLR